MNNVSDYLKLPREEREIYRLKTRIEALLYALHIAQCHNQELENEIVNLNTTLKFYKENKDSVSLGSLKNGK